QGGSMVLRSGDAIMITAHNGDTQSGRVFLKMGQESFETIPASPLVYTFSEPGDYIVEGTYRHENGQEFSGALRVSVRGFTFADRPRAYVGRSRLWETGDGFDENSSPRFEADPRLVLHTLDEEGGVVRFGSNDNTPMTVAARVPESSAI